MQIVSAWDRVMVARDVLRPTSEFYIRNIFDDFIELHGDRRFGDDSAVIAGIARLESISVTVIAQEKGVKPSEKTARNFGAVHPEGYRKALRLMKQADKFKRPVVTLIDTQGAYCGVGAEERGQGEAIASNLQEMMDLSVPVIAVVISEGGSGGALALAVANKVLMLENAVYTILPPEGFASILWKDSSRAAEAAEAMRMTAGELHRLKIIDEVVCEPEGGAQSDPYYMASVVKKAILNELVQLLKLDSSEIKSQRYERFRQF